MGTGAAGDTASPATRPVGVIHWAVDTEADRHVAERLGNETIPPPEPMPPLLPVVVLRPARGGVGRVRYVEIESTLAERLDRAGTRTERLALLPLFARVCETLAGAHAAELAHGALVPSAIVVGKADGVVIRAWEHAAFDDEQAARARWASTLAPLREAPDLRLVPGGLELVAHAAPERLRKDPVPPTPQADVYALGVVLHRILTGLTPDVFQTVDERLARVERSGAPAPGDLAPDVPPALSDLAERCLARRPAERPHDAGEVLRVFRAWDDARRERDDLAARRAGIAAVLAAARDAEPATLRKRLDDAVTACRAMLREHPNDTAAGKLLAEAESLRKRVQEAREAAERTLAEAREEATEALGTLEATRGELAEARAELEGWPARERSALHTALRKQRGRSRTRLVLGCLLAVVGTAFAAWLLQVPEHDVEVPTLVGLDQAEALARAQEAGLDVELVYSEELRASRIGKVLDATPGAGREVDPGSVVRLRVGRPPRGDLPHLGPRPDLAATALGVSEALVLADLRGWPQERAERALREAGFVTLVSLEPPPTRAMQGHVLRQEPPPGTPIQAGNEVLLVVGVGEPRAPRPAPRLQEPPAPGPDLPASCHRLDLWVEVAAPETVPVGEPFEVVAAVVNTGDVSMRGVVLALRIGPNLMLLPAPPAGAKGDEDPLVREVEDLPPGARLHLRIAVLGRKEGTWRIDASAREERGWGAAGAFQAIRVGSDAGHADGDAHGLLDLALDCVVEEQEVRVGEPFAATVRVTNAGNVTLENTTFAIRGGAGLRAVGDQDLVALVEQLEPGATRELTAEFVSDSAGERRVDASVREERGWAAAGGFCGVLVRERRLDLTSIDLEGRAADAFHVGERFLYVLEIAGDDETAAAEALHVVWTLPPELRFVSGKGEDDVTITGEGESATSSPFALAAGETRRLELLVEVVEASSTPVRTEASLRTPSGPELAAEAASTTLRPASSGNEADR